MSEQTAEDRLIVTELLRLKRSLSEVIELLDAISKPSNKFVAIKENIRFEDRQDLQTKVMTTLFALFAKVERELISERTREGLANVRASGKKLGRPKGSLATSRLDGQENEIRNLLDLGVSKSAVAKSTGASRPTCTRSSARAVYGCTSPRLELAPGAFAQRSIECRKNSSRTGLERTAICGYVATEYQENFNRKCLKVPNVFRWGIIYGSAHTPDQSGRGVVTASTGSKIVRNASSAVISGQNFTRIDSFREVSLLDQAGSGVPWALPYIIPFRCVRRIAPRISA